MSYLCQRRVGYTLIELLISISITLILITFGLSAYRQMQASQTVAAAESSILTILTDAEKKAAIGYKDPTCIGPYLGIQIAVSAGGNTMTSQALCQGGNGAVVTYTIANAAFSAANSLIFQPLAQGVSLSGGSSLNLDYTLSGSTYRFVITNSGNITYKGKQ